MIPHKNTIVQKYVSFPAIKKLDSSIVFRKRMLQPQNPAAFNTQFDITGSLFSGGDSAELG